MQAALHLHQSSDPGKRRGRLPLEAPAVGASINSLFFVRDSQSGRRFLVDTGSEVSALPASHLERRTNANGRKLSAANGSSISTYGSRHLSLRLGEGIFSWSFIIADVERPLLGADFLRYTGFLVDVRGQQLVDPSTLRTIPLRLAQVPAVHLVSTGEDSYSALLTEFPSLTKPTFSAAKVPHGVQHHIVIQVQNKIFPLLQKPHKRQYG